MYPSKSAVIAFSGKVLEHSFPLDALSTICAAVERELASRGVVVVRRVATLAPSRFIAAPFFLKAGFETVAADDEDVQATAEIFAELTENAPSELAFALGVEEPVSLLRKLAGRSTRRVLLTTRDVSAETKANLDDLIDVRELVANVGIDWNSLEPTNLDELVEVGDELNSFFSRNAAVCGAASSKNVETTSASEAAEISVEEAQDVYLAPEEAGPSPIELEAPEWNAALEQVLIDSDFKLSAYLAIEQIADRFPGLPTFFWERRDEFLRLLSPQIKALKEDSTTYLTHVSSPELRTVPAVDAVSALTLGGGGGNEKNENGNGNGNAAIFEEAREETQTFSGDEWRTYVDAQTFDELADRAALLCQQCRWSVDRIALQQNGADFVESILPRDKELERIGREKKTYLWPIHRQLNAEQYGEFAECYDVLSKAASLFARSLDPKNIGFDLRFLSDVAQVAANAQCLVKSALLKIDLNWNVDGVQRAAFNLLADFGGQNKVKLANMGRDDLLDFSKTAEVRADFDELNAEYEKLRSLVRDRRACEKKIEYHLKKLAADVSSLPDWEKVVDATTTLCETFREPPSSLWFRGRFLELVDKIPDEAPTTDAFARVVQEIDLFRLREEEEFLCLLETPETEYSPALKAVRERYSGANVVFIGGTPQEHLRTRLEEKLNVRLIWTETDHGDSLDRFNSLLRDDETRLFLIYIPWCSHKHSEEFAANAKNANKDFVRLRKGTNPEQIAQTICRQLNLLSDSELYAPGRQR